MRHIPCLALALTLAACGGDPEEGLELEPLAAPAMPRWERPTAPPALDHPFFDAHAAFADLSGFAARVEGDEADRPGPSHRGSMGVGNGNIFALTGLTDPLNTLHAMVGPTYYHRDRFFGDLGLRAVIDGEVRSFEGEGMGRPRGLPVVVTRGDVAGLSVYTVDLAPKPAGVPALDVPAVILRTVLVHNTGDSAIDAGIALHAFDPWEVDASDVLFAPHSEDDPRMAGLVSLDGDWVARGDGFGLDLGQLAPGASVRRTIAVVIGADEAALDAEIEGVREADIDAWMADTVAWWRDFASRGTQVETFDPLLDDFLDGLRVMVRVQQSAGGGVVPISRYTSTWIRDTYGPVRLYTRLGLFDEAVAALDYLHLCHRRRGDIGNSCVSGQRTDGDAPSVDWDALPELPKRVAAEGPSYLPLGWREVARWSGDDSGARAVWPYLRRSVLAQRIDEGGLQPWSGDETFRMPMNVAFGLPLEVPWEDIAWSSNSAFTFLPAARFLAELADDLSPDDARTLRERADLVQDGLMTHFLQPEGHFAAVRFRDPDREPIDLPFEDVNLHAIWTGALAPDDPVAIANLTALKAVAGRGDGSIVSPSDPIYHLNALLASGAATGMLPGFVLQNLAVTGEPEHQAAFGQVLAYASPTGHFDEGHVYADRSAFHTIYDPTGNVGDVVARYRPWESAIVGEAVLAYLIGAEPRSGGIRVRPRLTGGQRLRAGPVVAGDAALELELTWHDGYDLEVTSLATSPFELLLELPLGAWEDVAWISEGDLGAPESVELPLGERILRYPAHTLSPGVTVRVRVAAP